MRRRDFIVAIGCLAPAWPLDAFAQQVSKMPTIGVLGVNVATWTLPMAGFTQRLRELGWIEGRSIAIEYRWSEGRAERVAEVATEFVQQKVDVIVTNATSVPALERATRVIPIVFAMADDPVGSGLVPNLAHPGGNVTGMSLQSTDLASKRLEILREAVPNLHRLAIIANANSSEAMLERRAVEQNARAVGLVVASLEIRSAQDIAPAFDTLKSETDALYVVVEGLIAANSTRIITFATEAHLPTIFNQRNYVQAGAFMSYGPNFSLQFRRTAEIVDKILRGAKPGDIPVEQPTKFELVVNLTTAKVLGLTFPVTLLATADEVIE
jgi:putative tryptophan/tyrosine transport system substrate-binding protein